MRLAVTRTLLRLSAGAIIAVAFLTCSATAQAASGTPATTDVKTPGPGEVIVGAYIENIQGLDLSTNSFQADLYFWMRWMDPKAAPYDSIEVMNPHETWALTTTPVTPEPVKQSDGSMYYAMRYQGGFNTAFELSEFPFGEQQLRIQLEDKILEASQLKYVLDNDPIGLDPEVTLPGYNIGEPSIAVEDVTYQTNFGEVGNDHRDVYSRVTISIPVTHPFFATAVKVLLPIILVVVTASLIFQIPPSLVEARIGLGITALLTLVAMQWSAMSQLPDSGHLVMLDILYIVSFLFVLTTLIQSLTTSWRARAGDEEGAIRLDERIMVIDLVVFIAITVAVLWIYMR